jgi:hypothetical protein
MTRKSNSDVALETGMILFERETAGRPQVWTVSRVGKASATLIAHYVTCNATATIRTATLPEGWHIVRHDPLAAHLANLDDGAAD